MIIKKVDRRLTYDVHTKYLKCGDDFMYRNTMFIIEKKYERKITKKELQDYLDFIIKIKGITVKEDDKTFLVEASNNRLFRLIFKLFRYYRTDLHKKVIKEIIKISNKGFPFTTSIILGHYVTNIKDLPWSPSMDVLTGKSLVIDSGEEYFNNNYHNNNSINYFWKAYKGPEYGNKIKKLIELVSKGNYKEAQKIITN